MPEQERLLYSASATTSDLPKAPDRIPVLEHPANRHQVGIHVPLGEETWIITALDFIFNKATLWPCDGDHGPINYHRKKARNSSDGITLGESLDA